MFRNRVLLIVSVMLAVNCLAASSIKKIDKVVEFNEKPYLFEVVRHLYRWYMDEEDIKFTTSNDKFVFWVRSLDYKLDAGDNSKFGEIILPRLGIRIKVKKADYTIEKVNIVVKNDTFKIVNVGRIPINKSEKVPAGYTDITVEYKEMRDYLFKTRKDVTFPDEELILRIRKTARAELLDDLKKDGKKLPTGNPVIHISSLSPVANEVWVFWEEGRLMLKFASDIDLSNPIVWDHDEMSVKPYDIDTQVVVSMNEVAGSNAYMTRDQIGRALYNCIVLGKRVVLNPLPENKK